MPQSFPVRAVQIKSHTQEQARNKKETAQKELVNRSLGFHVNGEREQFMEDLDVVTKWFEQMKRNGHW